MLKAVLFDMDGVIIDSEHLHLEVDKKVMEYCDVNISSDYFKKFIGISSPKMWKVKVKQFLV